MFNLTTPLPTTTSGDRCDSQLPECCCNVVAWNLSMLCLKYAHSLCFSLPAVSLSRAHSCTPAAASSPGIRLRSRTGSTRAMACMSSTSTAVATRTTRLFRHTSKRTCARSSSIFGPHYIHRCGWMSAGGTCARLPMLLMRVLKLLHRYYTYFRETMQTSLQAETGKNLTHCAGASPVLAISTPQDHTLAGGAVAGGVAGGVLALLGSLLSLFFWLRRRRQRVQNPQAEEGTVPAEPPVITAMAEAHVVDASVPPSYANAFVDLPVSTDSTAYSSRGSNFGTPRDLDLFADPEASGGLGAIGLREGVAMAPQGIDPQNLRHVREKESGWRLSEKLPPPGA
jgi:hypothetical protein